MSPIEAGMLQTRSKIAALPTPQIPEAAAKALEELNSPEGSPGNEALRFPLSLGQRQEDVDHTGALCYVFDAIFNIDVVSAFILDASMMHING